ncbi:hypothetical protein [Rhodococcus jostii]|uniref:hypothetical protein n=1 Tax=Rhodococcus jostii TaxID=132919 RepID=UPI0013C35B32|nr:hypothetical protein [Rhodococcus jostii]
MERPGPAGTLDRWSAETHGSGTSGRWTPLIAHALTEAEVELMVVAERRGMD